MIKYYVIIALFFNGFCAMAQGLNFNDESYRKVPKKKSILTAAKGLPSKIDLSKYVPSVIDQENLGTCVGVSTTYYMRTILEAHDQGITNKDTINALCFSPSFLYNAVKNQLDSNCQNGTQIEVALEYLKKNGVAKLSQQGYPHCSPNAVKNVSKASKILDYVKLFGLNYQQDSVIVATKKALAEETPVVVGFQITDSLEQLGENGFWKNIWRHFWHFFGIDVLKEIGLWKPEKSSNLLSGHAVCVVGYDDDKFDGGAFRAVNSRGKYWGEDGFFWIRYSDYEKHVKYGFQAYLKNKSDTTTTERSADIVINYPLKVSDNGAFFEKRIAGKATNRIDTGYSEQMAAYSLLYPQYTKTAYQFSLNVDKLTYLYVLEGNASQLNKMTKLFPSADTVSAIIGANSRVILPSEGSLYALREPLGTEYWLFLFTETELDINTYLQKINNASGTLTHRVYDVFGEDLVQYQKVDYLDKKIGFTLKSGHEGHIVPLLISLQQIKRGARVFARTPR